MARPKYEHDEQTAKDRIVEAFWRMVEDGPYEKIGVRGLVRESGVNKNTFYYHFEGIGDLARQATRDVLEPALLLEMLSMMQSFLAALLHCFRRVWLLLNATLAKDGTRKTTDGLSFPIIR